MKKRNVPIVQYLVGKGADIDAKDGNEWTPLHYACQYGQLLIVRCLIDKGADIEAKDKDQQTPLHIASQFGETDVVKYLVSKGANINIKNKDGKTPYSFAKNYEIRKFLSETHQLSGTPPDPIESQCGSTPVQPPIPPTPQLPSLQSLTQIWPFSILRNHK